MASPKFNPDQGSLLGYIHPVTGESSSHAPLCACGACATPVEAFGAQPAVSLVESISEAEVLA